MKTISETLENLAFEFQDPIDAVCKMACVAYSESPSSYNRGVVLRYASVAGEATRLFVQARLAVADGDYSVAIRCMADWILAELNKFDDPTPTQVYDLLWCLDWLEDEDEHLCSIVSSDVAEQIWKKWPHTALALTAKAALLGEADFDASIDQLQQALKMNAGFWPARLLIAHFYDWTNRYQEASVQFRKLDAEGLIELNLGFHGIAWARCEAMSENWNECLSIGERLRKFDPTDQDFESYLGTIHLNLGNTELAINNILNAIPASTDRQL